MKTIKARDGIEAMHGLNDVYPGDDYPVRETATTSAGVTEEQVEEAARAAYHAAPRNKPFEQLSAFKRSMALKEARAALEASRVAPVSQKEAATYAENLARALWEKHYKDAVPQWEPLSGDVVGLLTQIDNMTAGLAPAPAGEPAIKALEWRREVPHSVARALGGHYAIERHEGGVDLMGTFIGTRRGFKSVTAAKAAAQADYEARIRAALTAPSASAQGGEL